MKRLMPLILLQLRMPCRLFMVKLKPKGNQLGFTLIEVIVSVVIFAIIMAIAYPGLMQFLDAREKVQEKSEFLSNIQKTFLFLSRDLRFASNRLGKDEYGQLGKTTLVLNDDGLLDFTGNYPDLSLDGTGVPRRVKWALEDEVLYRIQYPVMDPDGDTRFHRQALLSDVDDVEIELETIEDGRSSTTKRWDEETKLPDLLRFTIEFKNGRKYERVFTMIGGDKLDALKATLNSQPNNQQPPNTP